MKHVTPTALALLSIAGSADAATPAPASLARYFGFEEPRTVVVDRNCGPAIAADIDSDGKLDLIVVNNAKSRIEIHRQRDAARTDEQMERELKVNELPPSRWYDKTEVSVAHRVTGFRVHDIDGDGRQDIVYAGVPGEVVVLRQRSAALSFEVFNKRRVTELTAGQDGFEIADVQGDARPELLAIAGGKINVFNLTPAGPVGEPTLLGSGGKMVAFLTEDYNGDGATDILGVVPDDAAPLRLFLATKSSADKQLGPETRFEMPGLVEAEPLRFPNRPGASIAVIERASKRKVMYDLTTETVTEAPAGSAVERDAAADVYAFRGGSNKARSSVVADINADGKLDLLTTDQSTNSVVLYLQSSTGLDEGKPFSAFKAPKTVALGQWDASPPLEAFILSEEEKAVGISSYDPAANRLSFPAPINIKTPGAAPVAMNYLTVDGKPALAVVVKDKRDHALELHRPTASTGGDSTGASPEPTVVKLEGVSRPPQSMMSGDFDHDGKADILLFTPGEPMVMVRGISTDAGEPEVLTDKKMPNFGLVQAAGPDNTALLDVDNDSFPELLIADKNFVRFCALDASSGWKVVDQVTMPEASSQLTGLGILMPNAGTPDASPTIIASDKAGKRLILMKRAPDGSWNVTDKLRLTGFDVGAVNAGSFTGDSQPGVMVLADDAFAIVRLAGQRHSLTQFAAHRTDRDGRQEHEIEVGDLNHDGYLDMVVLDAGEQMCELFTFSASRKLHFATEWEVFESRLFRGGDSREFQPSAAIIADLTGDGLPDLTLAVHDRYMIYPQMKK